MIVCSCKATSDRLINKLIDRGASTVEEVANKCGAGTSCGSCRPQICEMLDQKHAHSGACECRAACEQAA